jgi:hypothetical protein
MTTRGNIEDNIFTLVIPDGSDDGNIREMSAAGKRMVGKNVITWLQTASTLFMLIPDSIFHA